MRSSSDSASRRSRRTKDAATYPSVPASAGRERSDPDMLASLLLLREEERNREIARQLQEDINQRLVALGMALFSLTSEGKRSAAAQTHAHDLLQQARAEVESLSRDIAHTSQRLHPAAAEIGNLLSVLRAECAEFARRQNITVRVLHRGVPDTCPHLTSICVVRVLQEALSNVARHAAANNVKVVLAASHRTLTLRVRDDGVGIAGEEHVDGLGVLAMKARATLVRGTVNVLATKNGGTEVVLRVPVGS